MEDKKEVKETKKVVSRKPANKASVKDVGLVPSVGYDLEDRLNNKLKSRFTSYEEICNRKNSTEVMSIFRSIMNNYTVDFRTKLKQDEKMEA